MASSEHEGTVTTTLLLGGEQRTLFVGATVLVRKGERDCYGAVIAGFRGSIVDLTFTPHGEAQSVPAGMIIAVLSQRSTDATLDVPLIPQYQPSVTVAPRRRGGKC